ncbi:PREDICTED: DNA-3-methyladenine glycosylase isoform X3 [Fragaria vesca subsp. vesca]|uniref:DNA-3-methyladenine glycosylase isoform X3 n=1 Tax=Fragaria vesca subsp. vesca TaxID=101020 RepID=UPI0002C364F5|nr:PREDICTED: DNA-3-methyladenine glycosylase isoform X3 [Fragaria vesca subsp. vesca]
MKRARRFKRVATETSKRPILSNRLKDDDVEPPPRQPSHSLTTAVVKPRSDSFPIQEIPPPKMTILPYTFFQIDALDLAPRLLGKFLRRDDVVLQITEVEAYRPNDSACHGRFGITPRTAPVFGPGGHAYVYLCYGLHSMLNVVADKEGVGAAVLIRACAPISGLETIQQRRGQKTSKPVLLTGPGKIGQALGLSTEWSNHPLYTSGINYALPEHVNVLWRFAIAGTPWISAPKNTLRPPSS